MRSVPLLLRALRWRIALSVAVWLCAVVVCGGAALGPVFALAAAESGLQDTLLDAGADTGVRLQGTADGSHQLSVADADAALRTAAALPAVAHRPDRFGTLFLDASGVGDAPDPMLTRMVWRQGACAQVVLVSGRCPSGAGEAAVSTRSAAQQYGWRLGGPLLLAAGTGSVSTRIVGVYRPIDSASPLWSGTTWFQASITRDGAPVTDTVFVSRGTFDRLPGTALVQEWVDLPLDVGSVRLADVPALRAQPAALRGTGVDVRTGLAGVLDRAEGLRARIDTATALVVVQLCVLGWLVLHQVLVDAVEARSADIALAKLRGFGRGALLRFGLGEPVLLLVAAIPVGGALGHLGARLLAEAVLRPGTPVVLPPLAVGALLAASVGGLVAVVRAARSALTRSVLDQWRRTRAQQRPGRRGLVLDAAVALLAGVAFVVLRLAGAERAGPLVLLGPGLLVAALGLLGARLLPVVLRPLVPATAWTRRIALLLAVRQVVRRPAGLRLVALLTVAVGLAVFGVGGQAVAVADRDARAAAEIGATRVVPLLVTPGQDVVAAVRRADPRGRWAAASATWLPFGGEVGGTVLAIDAARLRAVVPAAAGLPSPAALARLLDTDARDPAVVRGTRIAASVTVDDRVGGPAPTLRFDLRGSDGRRIAVESSALRTGTRTYAATVPCGAGCTFSGLTFVRSVEAEGTVSGTAVLRAVTIDGRPVAAELTTPAAWRAARPAGDASDAVSVTADGVVDRFTAGFGGSGGVARADSADPVPAVVVPAAVRRSRTGSVLTLQASDGTAARLRVAQADAVLPVVGDDGTLVDVRSFQQVLPQFALDAAWSVRLGPAAPADAVARLRAAGLSPDGAPVLLTARTAELARQGPALALLLLLVTAVSGALLAIGGTAVSIGAAVRRRSYEAAALGVVGVARRQVYGAALVEQLLLLGTSVVVGVPAGVVALALALPAIPQFADETPVPLRFLPPAGPVALFAVLFAALVVATGLLSAARVVRSATGDRLREAEE